MFNLSFATAHIARRRLHRSSPKLIFPVSTKILHEAVIRMQQVL